jgi:hypothetical protein
MASDVLSFNPRYGGSIEHLTDGFLLPNNGGERRDSNVVRV